MPQVSKVLLLLGGNEGDPRTLLSQAEQAVGEHIGKVLSHSREHWTEPWGFTSQDLFLNKALLVESALAPARIMELCLMIERMLGRVRQEGVGYHSRPIDIDILLIEELVVDTESLKLPHPQMHQRAFALAPAADVAPSLRHPILGRTVLQLLNDLRRHAA